MTLPPTTRLRLPPFYIYRPPPQQHLQPINCAVPPLSSIPSLIMKTYSPPNPGPFFLTLSTFQLNFHKLICEYFMGIPWFFSISIILFPNAIRVQISSDWLALAILLFESTNCQNFWLFFHYWPVICECHRAQQHSTSEQEEGCQEKSMAQVDSFIARRVKSTGSMFRKRKNMQNEMLIYVCLRSEFLLSFFLSNKW